MPPSPVWNDIAPSAEAVAEAHRIKEYRPTVVGLLRDRLGQILLVRSAHNAAEWMLVQGGIDEGEAPLIALAREIREEIEVGAAYVAPTAYVGTADLDAEDGRTDKRGFTKGKRYFVYEVAYRGIETLTLQRSELSAYVWLDPALVPERLATTRAEKRELILGALRRARLLP